MSTSAVVDTVKKRVLFLAAESWTTIKDNALRTQMSFILHKNTFSSLSSLQLYLQSRPSPSSPHQWVSWEGAVAAAVEPRMEEQQDCCRRLSGTGETYPGESPETPESEVSWSTRPACLGLRAT